MNLDPLARAAERLLRADGKRRPLCRLEAAQPTQNNMALNILPERAVGREKGMVTCPLCETLIFHDHLRVTGTFGGSAEVTARCPKCRRDVLSGFVDEWHVASDLSTPRASKTAK